MKFLIRLVLSVLIGITTGFIIFIMNDSVAVWITSVVAAFLVAAILGGTFGKSGLRLLIVAVGVIITFVAYFSLLYYLNKKANSFSEVMIIFCAPYVLTTYVMSSSIGADS